MTQLVTKTDLNQLNSGIIPLKGGCFLGSQHAAILMAKFQQEPESRKSKLMLCNKLNRLLIQTMIFLEMHWKCCRHENPWIAPIQMTRFFECT